MARQQRSLVALTRAACLQLLGTVSVGRVVFTERALPAVLPVSYAVVGQDVVISTHSHSRLARAAEAGVLAFEVDEIDPRSRTGWSVVLTGAAHVVTDPDELADAYAALDPWLLHTDDTIVRIPSTVLTGRRLVERVEAVG